MATYNITVASGSLYGGGTGSVFYINDVRNSSGPGTFNWNADTVLRFDQSDSTNDNHPLIFSTTTSTGGIISSGVTYYLDGASNQTNYTNPTAFNAASERYIEIDLSTQSNFYYLCWIHGIGMGGMMLKNSDQTYTVTVASGTLYVSGGTGNVYYLDGARNMDVKWVEGGTLRFNQNDASNDNHPLLFTTSTSDPGNNIISAGVTYYLDGISDQSTYTNTTNFNAATERYVEIAPASSTDFHFYCYVHGIGMGGAIDLTQNTWAAGPWGENQYGSQNHVDVLPSGLTLVSSQGDTSAFSETGWGRDAWGEEPWGDSFDPVVALPTLTAMSTALGTLPYAQAEDGWGRDTWGSNQWGTDTSGAILTGLEMSMQQGPNAWGESAWGDNQWGGELVISPESIIAVSGQSITSAQGSTTQDFDMNFDVTGVSTGAAIGTVSVNNGADHQQGLASLTIGSAVGSVTDEQTYEISGVSMGSSVGSPQVDDTVILNLSGVTMGSAIGSTTVDQMKVGLTGQSAAFSIGSTTVANMTVGLTGIDLTSNLGTVGFGALAYKDIDITATTTYTDITHAA